MKRLYENDKKVKEAAELDNLPSENENKSIGILKISFKGTEVPSKFLNVYDFGMKTYSTHPITAFLERKV